MKITSFYYRAYPNCLPADPMDAESEVYVEVANEEGDTNRFDYTYALQICTTGFLKRHLETQPFYCGRALIVVERFDDSAIAEAIKSILPNIEKLAVKK